MDYDKLKIEHDYDRDELADKLIENYNFSGLDGTGAQSDMLHYEGPDGQENGYAVVNDDTVTFVPYNVEIDDLWEKKGEDALEYLMEHDDNTIDLDQLYEPDSQETSWEWGGEEIDVTLDRDTHSQQRQYF